MEKQPLLQIKNITKRFGGLVAVSDLSIDLEEGGVHALIGPNGCGKTTTINMITGVLKPDEGEILFDGQPITGRKPYQIARLGMRRTYQNLKLFGSLTMLENVMVSAHMQAKAGVVKTVLMPGTYRREERELADKARGILEFLGVSRFQNENVLSLPYGIQKMTELAIAMIADPKLILLDEPAAGLNPTERAEFIEMLLKLFDTGVKMLIVEHNMDVVMKISKRISVMNFGVKIAEGSPGEVQTNEDVIKAYLGAKRGGAQSGNSDGQ
ncbi:ABC transporter ATP-binding protein [Feifania hominis]|uniref:ABC transporter ATP-binding protein n=1 Tax=Feifania hominis TaxID=2763660 RepID=A0A926HV88_9FIRM|nr:ABC transporter ATP-binding protein [Feifania hominis]MBC8536361.1 ABC transporter ATP-binding protein [Feifania hominis]